MTSRFIRNLAAAAAISVAVLLALQLGVLPQDVPGQALGEWFASRSQTVVLNLVVLTTFHLLALQILPGALVATASFGAAALFSYANQVKIHHTQTPILPHDLLLVQHAELLENYVPASIRALALALMTVLAVGAFAWIRRARARRQPKPSLSRREKKALAFTVAPGLALSTALYAGVYISLPAPGKNIPLTNMAWAQVENARKNGVPLTWLMNLRLRVRPPAGYSAQAIRSILSSHTEDAAANAPRPAARLPSTPHGSQTLPDLLFVMVESWIDPFVIPGLQLSRDPMAKLRPYQSAQTSGKVVVPVFGGMTANSEFEFLSGLPTAFLPDSAVVYQSYLSSKLDALPSQLGRLGYESHAIHNFDPWLWGRSTIYPNLGFKTFTSRKEMGQTNPRDWRPEDHLLEPKVMELLSEKGPRPPRFLFVVTMEMHGNYVDSYRPDLIQASAPWMTPTFAQELANYATALEASSATLDRFATYVKTATRPTLLVAFGDHFPALRAAYQAAGMTRAQEINAWSREENRKLHQTPYLVVSNFPLAGRLPESIGSHCLGQKSVELAGLELPDPFFRYLSRSCETLPELARENLDLTQRPHRELTLLAYDRLFGLRASMADSDH